MRNLIAFCMLAGTLARPTPGTPINATGEGVGPSDCHAAHRHGVYSIFNPPFGSVLIRRPVI